jgi:hypothetical protein
LSRALRAHLAVVAQAAGGERMRTPTPGRRVRAAPQAPIAINLALGPLPTPTRRLLWAAEGGDNALPQQLAERLAFEQDDEKALARALVRRLVARQQLVGQVSEIVTRCDSSPL